MDVANLAGKTVAVTGAGSGIGRETALAFAHRGADLELCDIDPTRAADTAARIQALGRRAHAECVDVASADAMRTWAAQIHSRVPAVDILVNNAGVAIGGGFLDTSLADWDWILGVNTRGVIHGCHFFVPRMVERGRGGHVVNIASAAGLVAIESLAAYCTTKFSVVGLSEALREELHRHRIGVTCVCPGLVNTPITRAARLVGPLANDQNRASMIRTYERRNYGPELVAARILRAVQRNQALAPITPEAWGLYLLKRFVPRLLARVLRVAAERGRAQLAENH